MKKNNLGFTFVEILVVVAILAIVSWVSISSFNKGFERQSFSSELNIFKNLITYFDKDIGTNLTDYTIYLSTWSFYYYYTNNLYKSTTQSISFSSFTWTIKTNDIVKNDIDLSIYFNNKKVNTVSISSTWSYVYNVSNKWKYEFKSYIWDSFLNSIFVEYFTKTDIKKPIDLTTIIDWSWNTYTWVIIKNDLWWKKVFTTFSGQLINSDINLIFEGNSLKDTLKLTK